jgi:hypothetical protein
MTHELFSITIPLWLKSYKQITSLNPQRDSNRYYVMIIVVEVVVQQQQQLGSSSRLLNM